MADRCQTRKWKRSCRLTYDQVEHIDSWVVSLPGRIQNSSWAVRSFSSLQGLEAPNGGGRSKVAVHLVEAFIINFDASLKHMSPGLKSANAAACKDPRRSRRWTSQNYVDL